MSSKIVYEQPLNERIRAFLRLEFLFKQARYHLGGSERWDSRAALSSLLEILAICGRADLKTEIMKELERHTANLARLEQNPEVDSGRLEQLLDEIDILIDRLHAMNGQAGQQLKGSELLTSVQSRSAIPGGSCDFDVPAYHHWLARPAEERIRDLATWFASFDTMAQSIRLILRLTRETSAPRAMTAEAGFYQQTLDPNLPCQLLRVMLPADAPWYAEISGGKHRFTVRFMEQRSPEARAVQTGQDVPFELACCII